MLMQIYLNSTAFSLGRVTCKINQVVSAKKKNDMNSTWRSSPQTSDSLKLGASFVNTMITLVDRSAGRKNAIMSLYLKAGG